MKVTGPRNWEDGYTVAFGIMLVLLLAVIAYAFFPESESSAIESRLVPHETGLVPGVVQKQKEIHLQNAAHVDRAVGTLEQIPADSP